MVIRTLSKITIVSLIEYPRTVNIAVKKKISILNCGKNADVRIYNPNATITSCIIDTPVTKANGQLLYPGIDPENAYIIYNEIARIASVSAKYPECLMYCPTEASIERSCPWYTEIFGFFLYSCRIVPKNAVVADLIAFFLVLISAILIADSSIQASTTIILVPEILYAIVSEITAFCSGLRVFFAVCKM